jgi:hypothetical protein
LQTKTAGMKNLSDVQTYNEVIYRIEKLQPNSKALWGKMNAGQMLAHLQETYKVPLSDKPLPRMLMGILIGWAFKPMLYNDKPWKRNLPTAPNFIIKGDKDFDKEKNQLLALINQFHKAAPENIGKYAHPMFGKFTTSQWGQAMYKHLDHHLVQFAV